MYIPPIKPKFLSSRLLLIGVALAALTGLSACNGENSGPNKVSASTGSSAQGVNPHKTTGKASIGGAYTLVDQTGKAVTDQDFIGRPQLIYFGFGYCPDICPTALQQMGAALEMLGEDADQFQPIFITVDPERDTPEQLAQFITANGFPKNLTALTGTQDQIDHVTNLYAVYSKKVEDETSAAGYTFDHSSIIYLMDKNGKFVDVFTHQSTPADIAKGLQGYLKSAS